MIHVTNTCNDLPILAKYIEIILGHITKYQYIYRLNTSQYNWLNLMINGAVNRDAIQSRCYDDYCETRFNRGNRNTCAFFYIKITNICFRS
jgi:hypothetical protein